MKYPSLEKYYQDMEEKVIAECVQCGECIETCPVFPVALEAAEPVDVAEKMFAVLEDGVFSEEAYTKAFSCMSCKECLDVCPQEIDPCLFHDLVKMKLVKLGKNPPEGVNFMLPQRKPFLPGILSSMQMKPSEARWLREAPPSPEKKEIVVFLGCADLALPSKVFAMLDILEKMDVDFAALMGGKLCCGIPNILAGQIGEAESISRELVRNIEAFSPDKAIVTCPACYAQFKGLFPEFMSFDFEVQFITMFLSDNLDRLKFTKPLQKKVTLHESCHLSREIKDHQSARNVIKAIPGLELLEMEHIKEESLCCGGLANITHPEAAMKVSQKLLEEAKRTGSDLLVNACPGCHLFLCPFQGGYNYALTHVSVLVNEAMGGREYEDKLAKYWGYRDLDKIVEASKEYIEANGLNLEEMKQMIPVIFGLT